MVTWKLRADNFGRVVARKELQAFLEALTSLQTFLIDQVRVCHTHMEMSYILVCKHPLKFHGRMRLAFPKLISHGICIF